jgi:DNA-directed RNA polymerase specialized sigma24 family protein
MPEHARAGDAVPEVIDMTSLLTLLSRLPLRSRQALLLDHGYGCGTREIADILGVSEGAVKRYAYNGQAELDE